MKALVLGCTVQAYASDGYAKAVQVLGGVNAITIDIKLPYIPMLPPEMVADVGVVFCMIDDLRHRGYAYENYKLLLMQIVSANPACRAVALYHDNKRYFKGSRNPDMSDKYFNGKLTILYWETL